MVVECRAAAREVSKRFECTASFQLRLLVVAAAAGDLAIRVAGS